MASPPQRLCECGCGGSIPEAAFPSLQRRFINGHNGKRHNGTPYTEEDRGHATKCWIWQGAKFNTGYGALRRKGKQLTAHRVFYETVYGSLGDRDLHHLCYVRPCVNPAHMQVASRRRHMVLEAEARSPLDWEDVRKIRRLRDELTQQQLARAFEVTQTTISKVLRNETWVV